MGLVVVGLDARDEGLALIKESGPDVEVDARGKKENVVGEVQDVANGIGVDTTVNISDNPGAAALVGAVTKMRRTVIQIAQVSYPSHCGRSVDYIITYHSLRMSQSLS